MNTESLRTETFIDKNGKVWKTSSDITDEFFHKIGWPAIEVKDIPVTEHMILEPPDFHDRENGKNDILSTIPDKKVKESGEQEQTTSLSQSKPYNKPFNVIQKWEGKVLEVGEETFTAELIPLKGEEGELIAEIYIDEQIDEDDLSLLRPGSIFYWTIGYKKDPYTMTISLIRFRRIPPITKGQLLKANIQASKLKAFFDAKKSTNTTQSK